MAFVNHFGAAGDGQRDDTEALEHALAAGAGVLELAKGSYRITRPIVIDTTRTGYAAVRGTGGTSRIIMDGAGPALRIVGDHRGTAQPQSYQDHTWDKERFPTISGIEILGRHAEASGIELRKTTKTTIREVLVRRCVDGIRLVERNRDFILSASHLLDNHRYGLFFDRCNLHQIIVHGNHISWNKQAGIKSLDGDVHNLQITGNDIEYNNHPGVDKSPGGEPRGAEIWFEAPRGVISEVTISSNTLQATIQPGGCNVRIHGQETTEAAAARLVTIVGNVLGSQTRGVELKHVERVAITGNTIYDSQDLSIVAEDCSPSANASCSTHWYAASRWSTATVVVFRATASLIDARNPRCSRRSASAARAATTWSRTTSWEEPPPGCSTSPRAPQPFRETPCCDTPQRRTQGPLSGPAGRTRHRTANRCRRHRFTPTGGHLLPRRRRAAEAAGDR